MSPLLHSVWNRRIHWKSRIIKSVQSRENFLHSAVFFTCLHSETKSLCLTGPVSFPSFPVLVGARQRQKQMAWDWQPRQKSKPVQCSGFVKFNTVRQALEGSGFSQ